MPTHSSLPFSLVRVMDVMFKVLTFLQHAYQPPQRFTIVYYNDWDSSIPANAPRAVYPFPQVCILDCFVPEQSQPSCAHRYYVASMRLFTSRSLRALSNTTLSSKARFCLLLLADCIRRWMNWHAKNLCLCQILIHLRRNDWLECWMVQLWRLWLTEQKSHSFVK